MTKKVAVVLFNLGGPDGPEAVEPFLFNLFIDPAIIGLPQPFRWLVAKLVSKRRAPVAKDIYAELGGGSPIVPLTRDQGQALEAALAGGESGFRTFIAMRYWHPFADEAAAAIKAWGADEIVLLPLYPHYSTTTTESSLRDWERAAAKAGLSTPVKTVCCYPLAPGFIAAHAALLGDAIAEAGGLEGVRILFSAHGLPKKVIEAGDPYQAQVEQTCAALVAALGIEKADWVTCYQSRVGPLEWIGPATDKEIVRAGAEGKSLIVVPIAFVSEHSETLVELDKEYGRLAKESGVPRYFRVPALGTEPHFIEALAGLVRAAQASDTILCPEEAAGHVCTARAGLKTIG
ncbi:ferrochelatase [Parvibaculum sp.]|uniref:ferrochelatase n=1 Tax=Parvibaculum sp. TaxID=2024848 RepID=UPI0027316EC4|nr:ferrochelatase [Parvibaculum sp.]MDP1625972.1 ferrochelatase [Parvibaculum sp.]MDP2149677.1 ferrochelatase [Parvibaculum sp.]MDP3328912.1 ferrochelatase [Parvibaculum sp.]